MSMFSSFPKWRPPALFVKPFSSPTQHDKTTASPHQSKTAASSAKPLAPIGNRIAAGIRAMMPSQARRLTQPKGEGTKRASPLPTGTHRQAAQGGLPTDRELLVEFHGELQEELETVEVKTEKLEDHLQALKSIIARTKSEEKSLIEYFVQNPGTTEETKGFQKALDKLEADQVSLKAEVKSTRKQIDAKKGEAKDLKLALANAHTFVQEYQEQATSPLTPKPARKAQTTTPSAVTPPLPKKAAQAAQSVNPRSVMPPLPQNPATPAIGAGADRKRFYAMSGNSRTLSTQSAALASAGQAAEILSKVKEVRRSYGYARKSVQAETQVKQLIGKLRRQKQTTSPAYAHVKAELGRIQLEKELHNKNLTVALARLKAATAKVV